MIFENGIIRIGKGKLVHGLEKSDGTIDIYISDGKITNKKNFSILKNGYVKLNNFYKAEYISEIIPLENGKKLDRLNTNFKIV